MSLDCVEARMERRGLPEPYDVLLGVEATLRLASGDGWLVYEEPFFPVVELGLAIRDWLGSGMRAGEDFSFDSVESDESGLLWCRAAHGRGWRIGSVVLIPGGGSKFTVSGPLTGPMWAKLEH